MDGYTSGSESYRGGSAVTITKKTRSVDYSADFDDSEMVGGLSAIYTQNVASAINEARDHEKKEMQDLNDRLGNYIDNIRGLESQNRKLAEELDALRSKWGRDTTSVRAMYEGELKDARKEMDEGAKKKAEIDLKVARLQDQMNEYRSLYDEILRHREVDRNRIESYTLFLANAETEIPHLRERAKATEEEINRLRKDNGGMENDLEKARKDLDDETLDRIDYQNQAQTLMEEIDFLNRIHAQEVKELEALNVHNPAGTRDFFKNELALAIRDIRGEYQTIADQGKKDMETWYKLKVQEVQGAVNRQKTDTGFQREETKRLRNQLADLRNKLGDLEDKNAILESQIRELNAQLDDDARQYESALHDRDSQLRKMRDECQALVSELQALLDTKQMLDSEIALYRKILEGEERHSGTYKYKTPAKEAKKEEGTPADKGKSKGKEPTGLNDSHEVTTRTSFQRSAKGNVSIAECNPKGSFIVLENNSKNKEESLDEWKLKRIVDGGKPIQYTFPAKFTIKPGKTVRVWSKGGGGSSNPPEHLVAGDIENFGTGANITTTLINKAGEDRAHHIQRTTT